MMDLTQLLLLTVTTCIVLSSSTIAFSNEEAVEEPTIRFTAFSMLPADALFAIEDGLGYREDSWNLLGSSSLEEMSWETNSAEVANFADNAAVIGIPDEAVWDCHINHYIDYWWSELEAEGLDVQWRALGYDATMWDVTEKTSEVEDLFWSELTDGQQAAATQLCYREEIWNEIPLNFWPDEATTTTQVQEPATLVPTVVQVAEYPDFRFVVWSMLDANHMSIAGSLGYTEHTWNHPGTAHLETLAFNTITSSLSSQAIALNDLGFNGPTWDCYMNHFAGFGWDSLPDSARTSLETLGWTAALWRGDGTPSSEMKAWSELSSAEQKAADNLCYSPLTWDDVPLTATSRWTGVDGTIADATTSRVKQHVFSGSWVAAAAGLLLL